MASPRLPTILYAEMPLCWTTREVDAALEETAKKWLFSEDEHAQLLGASWLLLGDAGQAAKEILGSLRSSANQNISRLAIAQAWRLVPPPKTMSELQGWMDYRDALRPPLQIGPTEFIADRLMRIGQVDLAIGQWLRIASQHGDRYHRAVPALKTAAQLLQREGQIEEAEKLNEWIAELANH
jgi:hypothetical protein